MKINSDIGLRDRSKITLSGFKGLDTLSASVDVSGIHATEMKNLISRDGVNHKRFGWKTQYRLRDHSQFLKIQGIFNFTLFHIDFLIAYASYVDKTTNNTENRFYLIDRETNTSTDITCRSLDKNGKVTGEIINTSVSPVDTRELLNTECKCFINGDKAYFIGCGDFLVFSKWNVGDNEYFELRRVVENEDVYIPTTTENIGSEEHGQHYTRITAEERNLLSPYNYNSLFGVETLEETDKATYYLDTKDFKDILVEVERKDGTKVVLQKINATIENIAKTGTGNSTSTIEKIVYEEGNTIGKVSFETHDITTTGNGVGNIETTTYLVQNDDGTKTQVTEKSCEIKLPAPSTTLIKLDNNSILKFSGNKKESSREYYGEVDGVKIYYTKPVKIVYYLYFVQTENSLQSNSEILEKEIIPVTYEVTKVKIEDGKVKMQFSSTINYGAFDVDLTQYGGTITSLNKDIEFYYMKEIQSDTGGDTGGDTENASRVVKLEDTSGKYKGTYEEKEGKLVLYGVEENPEAYCPLVPDVPNIKVRLYSDNKFDKSSITNAIKSCEFGAQGGTDRLFIVDSTGNTIRWSKDVDFTYFGDKSWCVCGTPDKSITGMDRLNDSTLLIVKEYSPREPSIFVITGNIVTGEKEGGYIDYSALFTPHGYQVGMGAVGDIVNFNGDCLMVAKDGLYAVALGENMTVDARYLLHRSRQISNTLEKFDLAKAKCVSFNGKFYVAVGGECFVADNKYTASFKGDMQNVVNYEWWRWTNIPVNTWGFVDNELWFGTEDGQMCSFVEDTFSDEIITFLYAGLDGYELNSDDEIVGLDLLNEIDVKVDDIIIPTCDFYGKITTSDFEIVNGETRFYLPLEGLVTGDLVYIGGNSYPITVYNTYFSISYTTNSKSITLYKNYKNQPLNVYEVDELKVVKLKDKADNNLTFASTSINPSVTDFTATLSHKEAVVAKWVSGATDLGTRVYSKSLTYLIITGEKDLANRLKYGIKTRFTNRDYKLLRANNDLDFSEWDLETVSLDSEFASSYARRLNVRDVNFIMFYFISDTAEDIALNSVQIEFKLYKRNKGVR